jgi:hypothetical protein
MPSTSHASFFGCFWDVRCPSLGDFQMSPLASIDAILLCEEGMTNSRMQTLKKHN